MQISPDLTVSSFALIIGYYSDVVLYYCCLFVCFVGQQ